jgi:hypothetical protein
MPIFSRVDLLENERAGEPSFCRVTEIRKARDGLIG